ncbi:hypothetical protein N7466_004141 [Penicillium verhagenii]|uniref:uncharacterized protein n=1 Tax=Penicillium verhagenii TaxID=1562060 RepID=UPI00254583D1|nr:uncharacterized protein N7466_004141 [Penicillium verhagenii]KAJ5934594.1 hypothetical protein N7466_004141 [Penicillium verhagenii]
MSEMSESEYEWADAAQSPNDETESEENWSATAQNGHDESQSEDKWSAAAQDGNGESQSEGQWSEAVQNGIGEDETEGQWAEGSNNDDYDTINQAMEDAYISASDTANLVKIVQELSAETRESLNDIAAKKADFDKAERLFLEAAVTLDVIASQLREAEVSRNHCVTVFLRARRVIEGAFALLCPGAEFRTRAPFLMADTPSGAEGQSNAAGRQNGSPN